MSSLAKPTDAFRDLCAKLLRGEACETKMIQAAVPTFDQLSLPYDFLRRCRRGEPSPLCRSIAWLPVHLRILFIFT